MQSMTTGAAQRASTDEAFVGRRVTVLLGTGLVLGVAADQVFRLPAPFDALGVLAARRRVTIKLATTMPVCSARNTPIIPSAAAFGYGAKYCASAATANMAWILRNQKAIMAVYRGAEPSAI